MKPKHSALSPLSSLLRDERAGQLLSDAAQSMRIKQLVLGWPSLRGVTFQVGPLQNGKLKLFVSTPAAISRLRQSTQSLVQFLNEQGVFVTDVQLRIQSPQGPDRASLKPPKRAVMSEAGKKAWRALENRLQDDDLLKATRALNRHHHTK